MISVIDKIKAFVYRSLRSTSCSANYSSCTKCKMRRRNYWDPDFYNFKPDYFVAYDHMLAEWVLFKDTNMYAKVWVMNEYVTDIYTLDEKLWRIIYPLCTKCIWAHFAANEDKEAP